MWSTSRLPIGADSVIDLCKRYTTFYAKRLWYHFLMMLLWLCKHQMSTPWRLMWNVNGRYYMNGALVTYLLWITQREALFCFEWKTKMSLKLCGRAKAINNICFAKYLKVVFNDTLLGMGMLNWFVKYWLSGLVYLIKSNPITIDSRLQYEIEIYE